MSLTVIRLVPPNTNCTPAIGSLRIGLLQAPGMAVPTYSPPITVVAMFQTFCPVPRSSSRKSK